MSASDLAEPDVEASDLTKFQVEVLLVIAQNPSYCDYGLGIKEDLQDHYGEEVNHGRLYPNLDELVDHGLLEKSQRDKRTNEYRLSDVGKALLVDDAMRRARIVKRFRDDVRGGRSR